MPTRREALGFLAGGSLANAIAQSKTDAIFGMAQGVAVAVDCKSGQLLASHRMDTARMLVAPPGSAIKPLSLLALLQSGKLRANETHPCSGDLRIAGRSFACSHPRMSAPVSLPEAIAYSCNEYVARVATRFAPGELAVALARFGLASRTQLSGTQPEATGRIDHAESVEANQLQALGEDRVSVTVLELAMAYHFLTANAARPETAPILEGLEGAVEFGTAQYAQVAGIKVAGKTGSAAGRWAWFAGFAPSRQPRVVVAILVQGRAGGSDAAPIGGKFLAAQLERKL